LQNELLLDRLVLLCSSVILAHVNVNNACFVLSESTHYQVQPLVEKLQEYISVNMETFLESRLLDDIPYSLVKQLSKFVRQRQMEKAPFSRGSMFVDKAMRKHAEWLALQDIPETIVRSVSASAAATRCGGGSMMRKEGSGNGGVSPPTLTPVVKKAVQKLAMTTSSFGSASNSNSNSSLQMPRVLRRPPSGDDIFMMDDNEPQASTTMTTTLDVPPMSLSMSVAPQASPPVWKAHGVPRYISFFCRYWVIFMICSQSRYESGHGRSSCCYTNGSLSRSFKFSSGICY
jgi:hypothetical protein